MADLPRVHTLFTIEVPTIVAIVNLKGGVGYPVGRLCR